jgi:Transposase zinc-binding domain
VDGTGGWPAFVRREFEAYLRCGILDHGFLRVRRERCGETTVVGFSCNGRGFCPSCGGRRMSELAPTSSIASCRPCRSASGLHRAGAGALPARFRWGPHPCGRDAAAILFRSTSRYAGEVSGDRRVPALAMVAPQARSHRPEGGWSSGGERRKSKARFCVPAPRPVPPLSGSRRRPRRRRRARTIARRGRVRQGRREVGEMRPGTRPTGGTCWAAAGRLLT